MIIHTLVDFNDENSKIEEHYICDACGKDFDGEIGNNNWYSFGYLDSQLDTKYHLCSLRCAITYITKLMRKNNKKDNRFEYGKGD